MFNYRLIDNPKNINANKLLIEIKKLLPKYLNCIPDNSAYQYLK